MYFVRFAQKRNEKNNEWNATANAAQRVFEYVVGTANFFAQFYFFRVDSPDSPTTIARLATVDYSLARIN